MSKDSERILRELKSRASPKNLQGMARFGINTENALGISVTELRKLAKPIGRNHSLALELWTTGIHEARILAAIIDEPEEVTEQQMDQWASEFDSWDVCDQACITLFDRTPLAVSKAVDWTHQRGEFVKRAGFALMAGLAVHDKLASDDLFIGFLENIKAESVDDRRYVKKAVNWALRQIGKRNQRLNQAAIEAAEEISRIDSRSARWIASDALRELRSEAVQKRLRARAPEARPGRCPSS